MIVTVTHQKGGVGKTTISMCLATYWHRQGRKVVLLDADPQRSSERWAARAETRLGKGKLPKVRHCADGAALVEACEQLRGKRDLIVIDTPPSLTAQDAVVSAIGLADLVLIPVRPSILDLDSLGDVRKLIERAERSADDAPQVLVTVSLARSSWSATREVRHSVQKLGYQVAKTIVHERAAHARAALVGSLWSLSPADRRQATGEVAALAAEIDALLLGEAVGDGAVDEAA